MSNDPITTDELTRWREMFKDPINWIRTGQHYDSPDSGFFVESSPRRDKRIIICLDWVDADLVCEALNAMPRIIDALVSEQNGMGVISWAIEPHFRGAEGRWMTAAEVAEWIESQSYAYDTTRDLILELAKNLKCWVDWYGNQFTNDPSPSAGLFNDSLKILKENDLYG